MSGRITDLEMHPTNNRILYTATAGGGVGKVMMVVLICSNFDEHFNQ
jgi:hypothetical protein